MTELNHERYMAAAIRLAARGLGQTWPNPSVGCLIVDPNNGHILASGRTQAGGRPHAEAMALAMAGEAARGATLYVTLEPCAHHGKTPPCSDAIIAAGIGHVVSALSDPDPRVNGQGYARIRAAGITVTDGILADAARQANIGYILRRSEQRPFIQLKLAHSRDGKIAGAGNKQVRITDAHANLVVHRLRAQADAIMIGSGTLNADNPQLTCRLPGCEDLSPVRVVLDSGLWTDPASLVVTSASTTPTWIFTKPSAASDRAALLGSKGVKIMPVTAHEEGLDIPAVLHALAEAGITRLLVEGGATVARALFDLGLADEIWLIEGDITIGTGGLPAFGDAGPELVQQDGRYTLAEERSLGQDLLRRYIKQT